MNPIQKVANRFAQLCRERKFIQAYNEFYVDENAATRPADPRILHVKKIKTVLDRIRQILANIIIHKIEISKPLFSGDYFALNFHVDFTLRNRSRKDVEELCICHVEAGKITWMPAFMD